MLPDNNKPKTLSLFSVNPPNKYEMYPTKVIIRGTAANSKIALIKYNQYIVNSKVYKVLCGGVIKIKLLMIYDTNLKSNRITSSKLVKFVTIQYLFSFVHLG